MPRLILSNRTSLRTLDVRPDDTDARDYIFQPSLILLPEMIDHRRYSPKPLDQRKEGACVGFALAAVINISLKRRLEKQGKKSKKKTIVSARMLYEMAKRYDEWEGEHYDGTSLRGAMKGWHKHGVTTEKLWPYHDQKGNVINDRAFRQDRKEDALKRTLGAYYRIVDSDVSHVQAAVVEGDAVFASAWVHSGWQHDKLLPRGKKKRPPSANFGLKQIPAKIGENGLHAFAIVGYTPNGFIIQNSWGAKWGKNGYAILGYDDWFENRQDAWVARPAPETRDSNRKSKIFTTTGFSDDFDSMRTSTAITGLNLDPQLHDFLINTGDNGLLSTGGRITTKRGNLPDMARQVLTTPKKNGYRHVILYAHGGAVSEKSAVETANRLFRKCKQKGLGAYFFVWESGLIESFLGRLQITGTSELVEAGIFSELYEWVKKVPVTIWKGFEIASGKILSFPLKPLWKEMMDERAKGASKKTGGASLFLNELFKVISETPGDKYKIHLVAHSAGSIYLGFLYEKVMKTLLSTVKIKGSVSLVSIQFLVPAITIKAAADQFGNAVKKDNFLVYTLRQKHEENEITGIHPNSVLTYVSKHLAGEPLLGIKKDFKDKKASEFAKLITATKSVSHMEFEDDGHEIELILDEIAKDKF